MKTFYRDAYGCTASIQPGRNGTAMLSTVPMNLPREDFDKLISEKAQEMICNGVTDSIVDSITISDREGAKYTLKAGDRFYAKDRFDEHFYEFTGRLHGYTFLLINLRQSRDICQTLVTSEWWKQRKITTTEARALLKEFIARYG